MATHVFDVAAFRATFPAFSNAGTYPDATLKSYWDLGTGYIAADDSWGICGPALQSALNYMAAHLAKSFDMITAGQSFALVKGSTVDKVSVQLEPPPVKNQWQWWLSTTPYGSLLWALLSSQAPGGFYVPGRPERAAFRKVGGRFY